MLCNNLRHFALCERLRKLLINNLKNYSKGRADLDGVLFRAHISHKEEAASTFTQHDTCLATLHEKRGEGSIKVALSANTTAGNSYLEQADTAL
ncbi:hypothetical protein NDU88_005949 [Pleurodeles waltl]|uniref:Uncharacterized protein n=1 Tax=Pleurodeles waltl TaxID=8319 RepID=A0AAV7MCQ3_PLEWA|nr:hypothetical protein NDU88_005949 [Pleurodeles waltl]